MTKIILIKNKIANLSFKKKVLTLLVLFFLSIPLISEAFIVGEIFALFKAKLAGLSEFVSPIMGFLVFLFVYLIVSGLALSLSISFLEFASDPANLTIIESEAVQLGWQFTSALANIAIVLGLIVIGIATILNKENWGAKKTLPKLIIAALLVNFSLLLVGAIVDISQILMNTFYRAEIFEEMTQYLWTTWDLVFGELTGYLISLAYSYIMPFFSPYAQFNVLATIFITGAFLPNIVQALVGATMSLAVASFFFIYGLLFVARIFILQILAIFAPLAFVAWALPTTEKYFDKWINVLVQWSFLGVILFFFILLGTVIVAPLQPEQAGTVASFAPSWLEIPSILYYYLFLAVYLAITAFVAKKWMPAGGEAIINGVKTAANRFQEEAQPITKPAMRRMKGAAAERTTQENIERMEKQLQDQTGLEYGANKAKVQFMKWGRRASTATGARPESVLKKVQKEGEDIWFGDAPEKEIKEILKRDETPDYRKDQAIQKLKDMDSDFSGVENQLVQRFNKLDKKLQKEIKKAIPNIHVKLADNVEEGIDNMIEEVEKMKPSETRDLKLDKMESTHAKRIAETLVQDGSVVKSWGDGASRHQKQVLIDHLDEADDDTLDTFSEHVSEDPEKWSGMAIPQTEGQEEDSSSSDASSWIK